MSSVIGFDLETMPITDQVKAPRPLFGAVSAPLSLAEGCGLGTAWGSRIRDNVYFFRADEIPQFLSMCFESDLPIVAHNSAFDWSVIAAHVSGGLEAAFKLFRQKRIHCTYLRTLAVYNSAGLLRQSRGEKIQLEHNKVTRFSLAGSLWAFCEIDISEFKDKEVQTSYYLREGEDYADWPSEYLEYLVGDVIHLPTLFEAQNDKRGVFVPQRSTTVDLFRPIQRRACFHFSLNLASVWGMRVDLNAVADLREKVEGELELITDDFVKAGFAEYLKGKPRERAIAEGKLPIKTSRKKLQEEVQRSFGKHLPKELYTDKGQIKTNREVLERCSNPVVQRWAEGGLDRTLLSTFIPALERSRFSDTRDYGILHTSFFPFSETGRVSAGNPNLLNLSREGGVRETIVARPGCVLVDIDYEGNEMRVLAQVLLDMLGNSKLASFYKSDPFFDPHSYMASRRLNIEYSEGMKRKKEKDEEFKKLRQIMKCVDFGFPGGMAARTFVDYCKGYKIQITEREAEDLKSFFFMQFPEVRQYLSEINRMLNLRGSFSESGGVGYLDRTGMVSGGREYCQFANFHFQSLAAEGALTAFAVCSERAYTDRTSALWGTRPLLFVHDEIILECPAHKGHDAAMELKSVMEGCMMLFTPDIPSVAEPAISRRWTKEAYEKYNAQGKLVPFEEEV